MGIGAQECLLGEVLGLITIPGEIKRDAVGLLLVPFHQVLKRVGIPPLGQVYEILIPRLCRRTLLYGNLSHACKINGMVISLPAQITK